MHGYKMILDTDLAALYDVPTKRLHLRQRVRSGALCGADRRPHQ